MRESLVLFESVINSRWFLRTSIILFLNKIDVFKAKLPKVLHVHTFFLPFSASSSPLFQVPLDRFFPEYTGGADVNKGAKYILWRFMQANRARLNVYPQFVISSTRFSAWSLTAVGCSITQATDTSNIRLVFITVKETILQNALKESGIL
jgi:guanine nucleotide-binding protein subunit alpha